MCSFVYVGWRRCVLSPRLNVLLVKTMHSEFLFPRSEWSWDQRFGNCVEGATLSPWAWDQHSHVGWTQSGPLIGFSYRLDVWNEIFNLEQKSLCRDLEPQLPCTFFPSTMLLPCTHSQSLSKALTSWAIPDFIHLLCPQPCVLGGKRQVERKTEIRKGCVKIFQGLLGPDRTLTVTTLSCNSMTWSAHNSIHVRFLPASNLGNKQILLQRFHYKLLMASCPP